MEAVKKYFNIWKMGVLKKLSKNIIAPSLEILNSSPELSFFSREFGSFIPKYILRDLCRYQSVKTSKLNSKQNTKSNNKSSEENAKQVDNNNKLSEEDVKLVRPTKKMRY